MIKNILEKLHLQNSYQQVGLLVFIIVIIYVLKRGKFEERLTILALMAAWFSTPYVQGLSDLFSTQIYVAAVDVMLLGVLLSVAVISDRYWPLWATSFQFIGVMSHAARFSDSSIWTRAALTGSIVSSYLVIAALVVGTTLETKRRAPVA